MTLKEALNLVAWATANFPQLQERDMRPTAKLWAEMLGDVPYEVAKKALTKVLATARYFPTVAEIREAVAEIQHGRPLTADEAWGMVMDAVKRYGYYYEKEAVASLPPEVASLVRRFGWREICYSENLDVIRGQFYRTWESHVAREREMAVLPEPLRQLIEANVKAIPQPEHRELPEPPRGLPEPPAPDNVVFLHIELMKKALREIKDEEDDKSRKRLRDALERLKSMLPPPKEEKSSGACSEVNVRIDVSNPLIERLKKAEEGGDWETVSQLLAEIQQSFAGVTPGEHLS